MFFFVRVSELKENTRSHRCRSDRFIAVWRDGKDGLVCSLESIQDDRTSRSNAGDLVLTIDDKRSGDL